ncbi:MAG TPA: hypothetical protein VF420_13330 [Casimicrobiaceae bacterium]
MPRVRDLSAATFHGDDFTEETILPLSALELKPPTIRVPGPPGMDQQVPALLQSSHLVGRVLVCVWVAAYWEPGP